MFWMQVGLPFSIALIGVILLISDSRKYQSPIRIHPKSNPLKVKRKSEDFKSRAVKSLETLDDKDGVRVRIDELTTGNVNAYGEFRFNQICLIGMASLLPFFGLALGLLNFFMAPLLSIFFGLGAYLLYDRYLTKQVANKRFQIEAEFPAIIEMLTLAIAAGETPIGALARISDRSDALLAKEFSKVVQEVRIGKPFHQSLDDMSRNLKSVSIRRFIDALVLAIVRGAPIVEVLYRHVAEARVNQRNLVMDKAGKAETTMMIPIVFLILPISVLFALWPSINQLSFFAS
ncbi:MAG: type II secretion system F family protein [Candidatus Nanopelagicaceae bacterium]|jgi:tight adherence protein C